MADRMKNLILWIRSRVTSPYGELIRDARICHFCGLESGSQAYCFVLKNSSDRVTSHTGSIVYASTGLHELQWSNLPIWELILSKMGLFNHSTCFLQYQKSYEFFNCKISIQHFLYSFKTILCENVVLHSLYLLLSVFSYHY